jgi:leucyl aminopeptidase
MEFTATSASLLNIKADSLILATGSQLQNSAAELDKSLDGAISSLVKAGDFQRQSRARPLVIHIPGASAVSA